MVSQPSRHNSAIPVAAAVAFIALMTLLPSGATEEGTPFGCILCGSLGGVDFFLNIFLFVPFGLALYRLTGSTTRTILAGVALTIAIEVLQWRVVTGRDTSLGDLLANSVGTGVGVVVANVGAHGIRASGRLAKQLAMTFAFLSCTIIVVSAWMLRPISVRQPLFVQWEPLRTNLDDFPGVLLSASLNGRPIRPIEVIPGSRFLDPLTQSVSITTTVRGPIAPTRKKAAILRLANNGAEGIFVGQWRDAVIVRTHMVAERLRFRPLLTALEGAFAAPEFEGEATEGATTFEVVSNPRAITISRHGTLNPASVTVRRTVGLGWTLILPWDVAVTPRWWLANAAWSGALMFPVAFFSFRAGRHRSRTLSAYWPLLLTLGFLVVLPVALGLSVLGVQELVGVAAGILSGRALERTIPTELPTPLKADANSGSIHA